MSKQNKSVSIFSYSFSFVSARHKDVFTRKEKETIATSQL